MFMQAQLVLVELNTAQSAEISVFIRTQLFHYLVPRSEQGIITKGEIPKFGGKEKR